MKFNSSVSCQQQPHFSSAIQQLLISFIEPITFKDKIQEWQIQCNVLHVTLCDHETLKWSCKIFPCKHKTDYSGKQTRRRCTDVLSWSTYYAHKLAYTDIISSSACRANSITGQKLSVCVFVNQSSTNHNCWSQRLIILPCMQTL